MALVAGWLAVVVFVFATPRTTDRLTFVPTVQSVAQVIDTHIIFSSSVIVKCLCFLPRLGFGKYCPRGSPGMGRGVVWTPWNHTVWGMSRQVLHVPLVPQQILLPSLLPFLAAVKSKP